MSPDTPTMTIEDDPAVAAATTRLGSELRLPRLLVHRVVRACRRDLAGAPPGALPELVERLARERLRRP
jgi:hypothetical protein